MATIPDLAPDLIAAGFTPRELRRALRPREAAPPPPPPVIAPKRWKMAFQSVLDGRTDEQVRQLCCVPQEVVDKVRAQVAAVRAKLASLDPVPYDEPEKPQPGDPDYVEPIKEPDPKDEPVVEPPVKPPPAEDPGLN